MEVEKANVVRGVKSLFKRPVTSLLFHSGYYHSQLRRFTHDRAVVLMYHRVSGPSPSGNNGVWYTGFEHGVSCEHFESHMRFIREELNPIALCDLVNHLYEGEQIPSGAVAVTFDDGYKDNFMHAYPILKKYQIPASIFIATGFIESSQIFWWDQICEMLRRTQQQRLDLRSILHLEDEGVETGSLSLSFPLVTGHERMHLAETLIEIMRSMVPQQISETLSSLQRVLGVADPEDLNLDLMLTWRQIQEMSQNGVWIEPHTHSHLNLALLDPPQIEDEFRKSKQMIEAKTERQVCGVAYPGGGPKTYTDVTMKIAQEVGFRYACITQPGNIRRECNPFVLRRIGIGNLPLPVFIHELKYVYGRD